MSLTLTVSSLSLFFFCRPFPGCLYALCGPKPSQCKGSIATIVHPEEVCKELHHKSKGAYTNCGVKTFFKTRLSLGGSH